MLLPSKRAKSPASKIDLERREREMLRMWVVKRLRRRRLVIGARVGAGAAVDVMKRRNVASGPPPNLKALDASRVKRLFLSVKETASMPESIC